MRVGVRQEVGGEPPPLHDRVEERWRGLELGRDEAGVAETQDAREGAGREGRASLVGHLAEELRAHLYLPYTSPTSPLYLPYISPISPLHLPYISPTSHLAEELRAH